MMCTMQNHIIQVFANSGNVIKPIGVLNELKSKYAHSKTLMFLIFSKYVPEMNGRRRCVAVYLWIFWREKLWWISVICFSNHL